MDKDTIAKAMSNAVGDPSSGLLHDAIPGMAEAVHALLNPAKGEGKGAAQGDDPTKAEQRVVKAEETR
jgi:hypothetical protein